MCKGPVMSTASVVGTQESEKEDGARVRKDQTMLDSVGHAKGLVWGATERRFQKVRDD